jgi:hypothetical protein
MQMFAHWAKSELYLPPIDAARERVAGLE